MLTPLLGAFGVSPFMLSVYGERLRPGSEEHQQMAMTIVISELPMFWDEEINITLRLTFMSYCDINGAEGTQRRVLSRCGAPGAGTASEAA